MSDGGSVPHVQRRKSGMKIGYRRSNNTSHSKPLFVAVSKFDTDSFPVPVRHLRLRHRKVSETSSRVSNSKRRGKTNSIDVVPKSLDVRRRRRTRRASRFL